MMCKWHLIKVVFANGDSLRTQIWGTAEQVKKYYLGNEFNIGDPNDSTKDNVQKVVGIEFLKGAVNSPSWRGEVEQ